MNNLSKGSVLIKSPRDPICVHANRDIYAGDQYTGNDKGKIWNIINITSNMDSADDNLR